MSSCREARDAILAAARGQVTEAQRLRLDEHLAGCAACREERGQWMLLERLGSLPPPRLGAAAQQQILRRLVTEPAPAAPRSAPVPAAPRRWALGLAAAAVLLLAWRLAPRPGAELAAVAPAQREAGPATLVEARQGGQVTMQGVTIEYAAGTRLRLREAERQVELLRGEVEVDVTPQRQEGARFRVLTAGFIVEVLGTRFRVTEDGVLTLRGRVQVLDRQGRVLSVLGAGERWSAGPAAAAGPADPLRPAAPAAARSEPAPAAGRGEPAPAAPPAPASAQPAEAPRPTGPAPQRRPALPSAGRRIAEARSALASGDVALARRRLGEARAAAPSRAQRAALGLIEAECLLSERRYDQAIAAYRGVSQEHADDPAGETAAFAVAQLLSERGAAEEARSALEAYLRRYPQGRFVREVSAKLRGPSAKR